MCWDFSCYYCAGLLLEDKHVNSQVSLDIVITVSGAQQSHLSVLQKQHLYREQQALKMYTTPPHIKDM